jgi:hypothetical protein
MSLWVGRGRKPLCVVVAQGSKSQCSGGVLGGSAQKQAPPSCPPRDQPDCACPLGLSPLQHRDLKGVACALVQLTYSWNWLCGCVIEALFHAAT